MEVIDRDGWLRIMHVKASTEVADEDEECAPSLQ